MKCPVELIGYMHDFLDEDLSPEGELELRGHLQECEECRLHFAELKKSIALVSSLPQSTMVAPDFTHKVMASLPKEKKTIAFKRQFQAHPFLTAAAVFVILMAASLFGTLQGEDEFSVSKQPNLVIQNNTVIVPKGEVVKGDVVVKNGDLKIEGEVKGDVTVINGEQYMASAGHVTGEIEEINQAFDFILYEVKKIGKATIQLFQESEQE